MLFVDLVFFKGLPHRSPNIMPIKNVMTLTATAITSTDMLTCIGILSSSVSTCLRLKANKIFYLL